MTLSDPSATLEEIKERSETASKIMVSWKAQIQRARACAEDVPRLVAALEAVLANHQPGRIAILGSLCKRHENHRHFSITRTEADDVRACPDCAASVYTSCTGCNPQVSIETCPDRLAITRALNGDADA